RGNSNASGTLPRAGELAFRTPHPATIATVCAVNPVVEAPGEAVEQRLDVQFVHVVRRVIAGDTGEHHLAHVGHAIAVRVLAVKNVGCRTDNHAAVPTHHRGRPR